MVILLSIIAVLTTISSITLLIAWQRTQSRESLLKQDIENFYNKIGELEDDINNQETENKVLNDRIQQFLKEKTEAITRLESIERQLHDSIEKQHQAEEQTVRAVEQKFQYQKEAELAFQRIEEMENRMMDWEQTKEESLKAAKEAMFETGGQVFRKEAENVLEKTQLGFKDIINSVGKIQERLGQNESLVGTVWQALKTPAGVGQMSEVGLENTLLSFGLEAGRDFVTQYSVTGEEFGSRLRPDVVVFLPAKTVLVIDSKASKFFLELAEEEGGEREEEIYAKLKKTMHDHLRSLASKNYKEAVKDYMKSAGKNNSADKVFTVMFLHTESSIEKICKADPTFKQKAQELGIIIAGPTGLAGLMSLAQIEIQREIQDKNQQHIIDELGGLLSYLETALGYASQVGKSLRSAAEHYHKFTKSVNSRLLPKARKFNELGIQMPKNKHLPNYIQEYHVVSDNSPIIEGQSDDHNNEEGSDSSKIIELALAETNIE